MIYNPIQLDRAPVSHEAHMENASAYFREALLMYFRGIAPLTPDRPFRLPHDGSKCATAGAKRVRNDRMRSRHENTELNDREREFWRLIERGYTCPSRLAVEGRSNGGLLMGVFLTQHPDLARVVIAHVGIYDMLRFELEPNGEFNIPEFGTVKDSAQFRAMHAYSPYHGVRDGTQYPAVLILAGEKDGRVNPANSRKMAARLQQANASTNPVLLRLSSASGHGMGTALAERIAENADVLSFLFTELGMMQPPSNIPANIPK
jgi:pimeloyl-ACP methyl ester carboxylesterase